MTGLHDLPVELTMEIIKHLNIKEYHNLNLSNRQLTLPKPPTLLFSQYEESTMFSKKEIPMKLCMKNINVDQLLFLAKQKQQNEFIRGFKKLSPFLTQRDKQTCFEYAIPKGLFRSDFCIEMVKCLLLDGMIRPCKKANLLFNQAASIGDLELLELLLEQNLVDPFNSDNIGLRLATSNGHDHIVAKILKHTNTKINDDKDKKKKKRSSIN
ncbi:hypothetical protein BC833DRAFT_648169 [Globomyces pollinis-pini]|nr:hypothetical protein BC833DRAFT_648169 [Globomyces pollinis-pini]